MPHVYFIRSKKKSDWVYIGSTENVEKRILKHNSGGVFSTKGYRPFVLIHTEQYDTISKARSRERELKGSRSKKNDILKALSSSLV